MLGKYRSEAKSMFGLGLQLSKVNFKLKNELSNDFEEVIFKDFPEIGHIKNLLYKSGAVYSSLTGSGSAMYALSKIPLDIKGLMDKYFTWSGIIV